MADKTKAKSASRRSPLGYEELLGHPGPGPAAVTRRDMQAPYAPYSVFSPDSWDAPEAITHERIHQAQFSLGRLPTDQQVASIFGTAQAHWGNAGSMEPPAYAFESLDPFASDRARQQELFNRYADLLERLNRGKGLIFTTQTPIPLQRGYANHPMPITPPGLPPPPDTWMQRLADILTPR